MLINNILKDNTILIVEEYEGKYWQREKVNKQTEEFYTSII